jgi:hypothetical protein
MHPRVGQPLHHPQNPSTTTRSPDSQHPLQPACQTPGCAPYNSVPDVHARLLPRIVGDTRPVGEVNVELRRSGFADWQLEYAFDHWIGIVVVLPLALLSNLLTHLFVFRCGWTLHVSAGDYYYKKVRYRSKAAAQADIERQRELAAAIAPPAPVEPTRLPTRGGSLRRPW